MDGQNSGSSDLGVNRKVVATQSPWLPGFDGYPGKRWNQVSNLEEVASDSLHRGLFVRRHIWRNPVGVELLRIFSQGSRQSAATLGFGP